MIEVDLRLMRAAVAVAEELSFSRAALHLHISQPALTKQIQDLESLLKARLFERNHQKVSITDAGRAFVAEARLALLHHHRAVNNAKNAANKAEAVLNVGHSPYTNPFLTSLITSVHLPLYPSLQVQIHSDFSPQLSRGVLSGELDLALLAMGDENPQLSAIELSRSPLFLLIQEESPLASKQGLSIQDLDRLPWVLFPRQVHPALYQQIEERASTLGFEATERHEVTSAEHAAQLVKSTGGVAFLTKNGAWRVAVDGLTIRPLDEPRIFVKTVICARNDGGRIVSEYTRALVRKAKHFQSPEQRSLRWTTRTELRTGH